MCVFLQKFCVLQKSFLLRIHQPLIWNTWYYCKPFKRSALVTHLPLSVFMCCLLGRPDNAGVTGPDGLARHHPSQPSDWEEEVIHPSCLCFLNRWHVCTLTPNLRNITYISGVIGHALLEQVWDSVRSWTMSLSSTPGNLPSSRVNFILRWYLFSSGKVWPWDPVYTTVFSFKTHLFSSFCPFVHTEDMPFSSTKTECFKNVLQSGYIWKQRFHVVVWIRITDGFKGSLCGL